MQTVVKKAWNPDTGQEYEIELPTPEVVRKAILELDYPPDGIKIKNAVSILAEKLELSDKQRKAVNKHGWNVFRFAVVIPQFQILLKKAGTLVQPEGPRTPYFLAENPSLPPADESNLNPDLDPIPETSIEENYQQIRTELAANLLQEKIKRVDSDYFAENTDNS